MKIPREHIENEHLDTKLKGGETNMKRKVFCPICGEGLKVSGKVQFKHCEQLHSIADNLEKVEQPVKKIVEKVEESHNETPVVKPIIVEKPVEKPVPKKKPKKKKTSSFIEEKVKSRSVEEEVNFGFF